MEKYATPYYVSNTLNNRKREYSLFEENSPTFFKIQGDGEDYKAKYVKSKYIYTNIRYFVSWVGCNTAQIKLNNQPDVVIEEKFDFVTMGNWRVWGMIVTFQNKNPELRNLPPEILGCTNWRSPDRAWKPEKKHREWKQFS